MTCPKCGSQTMPNAQFCHQCGQPLEAGTETGDRGPFSKKNDPRAFSTTQGQDEQSGTLWEANYSAKGMVNAWLFGALLTVVLLGVALAASLPAAVATWLLLAIPCVWALLALALAYRKLSVSYLLTDQRLLHQRGLLHRYSDRIEVIDMDDISYDQGLIERLLGVGRITITSSDRTHPEITLPGIDRVHEVASLIDDVRRRERIRRGIHIESI